MKGTNKIHRGWVMPFMCAVMIAGTSLLSTGMSTSLNAIKGTYGLSGTKTSMIMTVRSISAFIVMFVSTRYFNKFGIRKGTALAMVPGVIAFLIFAYAKGSITAYYIAAAAGGITYAYGLMLPASMLLKRWFNKHRGLALSIASAGTGLCSIVGAPLLQTIIDKLSLTAAFLFQAFFLLFVSVLLLLIIVDDPKEAGLEPVGGKDFEAASGKKGNEAAGAMTRKWTALMFISALIIGVNASPASSHLTLNFTTDGFDAMLVAKAISVYGFTLIIAKILYGTVLDKIGAQKTILLFGTIVITGKIMCWAATYANGTAFLFAAACIYGFGVPIETLGYPNWCADLSNAQQYPVLLSTLQMGYQLGALLGSSLPGISCDLTGTYGWFYLSGAVFMAVAFIIMLTAYKKLYRH